MVTFERRKFMGISILGSLGAKFGFNLVGSIMNKTLPKAMSFVTSGMQNPLDRFESVLGKMNSTSFKTSPAKQFTLKLPYQLKAQFGSGPINMNRISERLKSLKSVLGTASEIVDALSRFQNQRLDKAGGKFSGGFGQSLSTDTNAMSQSSGFSAQSTNSSDMSPMGMFKKLQDAQKAAQMFELAVKLADIQHQASMSAIRSIRY
jgi:hypothetical protein